MERKWTYFIFRSSMKQSECDALFGSSAIMEWRLVSIKKFTKRKFCYFDEIYVTGCTGCHFDYMYANGGIGSCHFDKFRYCQTKLSSKRFISAIRNNQVYFSGVPEVLILDKFRCNQ